MHAYSTYTIKLDGSTEDIKKATAVLAVAFDDDSMVGQNPVEIEETCQIVWVHDVVRLAELMVKNAPDISFFIISGIVDTSESAGEYMNFVIKYENGSLTVQSSCWYLILYADEFDDYDEFCEVYDGYSEDEFEELRKCTHYVLDSGSGDIVTEVPLDDPEVIDLDATTVYVDENIGELSLIPLCQCECGNKVTLKNNNEIFVLYTGASMSVYCDKCGKKYKVLMK